MTLTPTASGFSSSAAVPASVSTPPFAALAVDHNSRLGRVSGFSGFAVENAFCTSEAGRVAADPADLPACLGVPTVLTARPAPTKANSPAVHVRTKDGGPFGGAV